MATNVIGNRRSGFTIAELIVVITIIGIVVGIVVPALGHARNLAKRSVTSQTLTHVNTATAQFINDRRSLPGQFTARDMGAPENATRGFSAGQNLMLGLIDPTGLAISTTAAAGSVAIGPIAAKEVFVNLSIITAPSQGSYFSATPKNFVAQDGTTGTAGIQNASVAGHSQLPTLVDGWGNPMLVWAVDDQTNTKITNVTDFAAMDSSTPSRFYASSNAAFIKSTQLGKAGEDQNQSYRGSILIASGDTDVPATICGIMGQPGSVKTADLALPYNQILPTAPRSSIMVQSAGTNGVFLGRKERGAKNAAFKLNFGLNFKNSSGVMNQGVNGGNIIDVRADFDDLFGIAGN